MNDLQVVTDTGLNLPEDCTVEELRAVGRTLGQIEHGMQWAKGDWFNRFRDKETQRAECEKAGLGFKSARDCGQICAIFPSASRDANLGFQRHKTLRNPKLTPEQRRDLLEKSAKNPDIYTVSFLRAEVNKLLGIPEKVPLRDFDSKKDAILAALPPGASKKLRRAVDEMIERLKHDFQKEVDHAVRERLKEDRKRIHELEAEARKELERARNLRQNLDGLMSEEEYKLVRSCLHPDRAPSERHRQFTKAFDIFNRLEKTVNREMPIQLRRAHGWS